MTKIYCVELVYNSGKATRVTVRKATWDAWAKACSVVDDTNSFYMKHVLVGYSNKDSLIVIRAADISAIQFRVFEKPINIAVKEKNPLNEESHYENPLS